MFSQPPRKRMDASLPIKGIVFCATAMGISFGLCGLSVIAGIHSVAPIAIWAFALSFVGLILCVIWAIVAAIVNSFF